MTLNSLKRLDELKESMKSLNKSLPEEEIREKLGEDLYNLILQDS
jgi:hypothetical protein